MMQSGFFKTFFICFSFLATFLLYDSSYAEYFNQKVLRVAVLDNPNLSEKAKGLSHYENTYLEGMDIAVMRAKKMDIDLQYRAFFYGTQPLDIFKQIPKVMDWKPDLILGPHYSNQFLLLKRYFPTTMVLSSYATAPAIYQLPDNFYSIFPPDDALLSILAEFMYKKFPHKNVDMIFQADCKSCVDIAQKLSNDLFDLNANIKTSYTEYIGDNIQKLHLSKIIAKHKQGNLIFFVPINYYVFLETIFQIANYLEKEHLIFFTVLDFWGNAEFFQKLPKKDSSVTYEAYRIGLLLLDDTTDSKLKTFKQLFSQQYGNKPIDAISYMTYLTAMSAVSALKQFPTNKANLSMRECVLESYRKALASDPNWFRPEKYGIYYYTNANDKGETLVHVIPVFKPS